VTSVEFSRDGKRILTASNDHTARVWNAAWNTTDLVEVISRLFQTDVQRLVDEAKAHIPRCLTLRQRAESSLDLEVPDWCYDMAKWPYQPRRLGLVGKDVTDENADRSQNKEKSGVVVSRVIAGLPAELAGLKVDDIVLDIGGQPASAEALRELENTPDSAPKTFTVLHNGQKVSMTILPRLAVPEPRPARKNPARDRS